MSSLPLPPSLALLQEIRPEPAPPPRPAKLKLPPRPPAIARAATDELRPAPRQVQPQPQRPQRNATHTQTTTRGAQRQQAERETRTAALEGELSAAGLPLLLTVDGQGGQRGQGGGGNDGDEMAGGAGGAGLRGGPDDVGELDCALLAAAMPAPGEEGIFDVLLPCGARLGVAVDIGLRCTSFLLMPSTERLRAQIKKKRMELENRLAQRMETQVRLTVL